jgi:hypothetical protein
LRKILPPIVVASFEEMKELPRVDQPYNGDQKCIKEEHHRLLLNDAILLAIDIMKSIALNDNSHQGSSEEQSKGVLQSKRKLVFATSPMHFEISDVMQQEGEYKLIEEGDENHR